MTTEITTHIERLMSEADDVPLSLRLDGVPLTVEQVADQLLIENCRLRGGRAKARRAIADVLPKLEALTVEAVEDWVVLQECIATLTAGRARDDDDDE